MFYDKALSQISTQLDSISTDLYINKLEIELGKTSEQDFERDFRAAFIKGIGKHIDGVKAATDYKQQQVHSIGLAVDSLFYFLERGYWRWNIQQKNEKEVLEFIKSFFQNENQVLALLQKLTSKETFPAERLLSLVSSQTSNKKLLANTLEKLHPAFQLVFPEMLKEWQRHEYSQEKIQHVLIAELLVLPPVATLSDVLVLIKKLFDKSAVSFVAQRIEIKTALQIAEDNIEVTPLKNLFFAIQKKLKVSQSTDLVSATDNSNFKKTEIQFKDEEPDKINISNAGLVLFHPFLPQAFLDLKWIGKDNKFVNAATQQKAVLFLQYLINRKSRQAEHLLVLNKIMCGWPVHLPVKAATKFSQKEKQAADDLIDSLKEYWTIVKNTSPQGLIISFIERNGIIQKTPSGYLLQVERKTIDILTESLPYSINTIKLPWNEGIIYTEW